MAQVLCFAYPLVGTYGVDERRFESERVQCEGVVMRDARPAFAGWLRDRGVVALSRVDTRTLVRRVRSDGVVRCALGEGTVDELQARALAEPPIDGRQLDRAVGTAVPYSVGAGPRVVVIDLGTKYSIPRRLAAAGLEAFVVPGHWDEDAVLEASPARCARFERAGRSVRAGRADRDDSRVARPCPRVRDLSRPSAARARTRSRHVQAAVRPSRRQSSGPRYGDGRVLVTVQNHGYAVAAEDDSAFVSLNDGTCEGLVGDGFASVQFHPEASPGPLDGLPFFDRLAQACRSAPTFARS